MGNTFKGGRDQPHKKIRILIGSSNKDLPALSIQCFENRHSECIGFLSLNIFEAMKPRSNLKSEKCECRCHKK
jgi:hypothetical protein